MRKLSEFATVRQVKPRFSAFLKFVHYNALLAWRTRDFWLRAALCLIIGTVLLINDEASNFDVRLKVRGPRTPDPSIVIVDIEERDWASLDTENRNILRPLKELVSFSDAYLWSPSVWERLLSRILMAQPKTIGITLFFGDNVRSPRLSASARTVFENDRIIWGADVDNSGRLLPPMFASTSNANVGLRAMRFDDDGVVRRFSSANVQVAHLAVRMAMGAKPELVPWLEKNFHTPTLINYHGDSGSFRIVSAKDIVEGRVPLASLKDKIILIGSLASPLEQMQTPLGRMSRAEITANIVDNVIRQRTVTRFPNSLYFILLALMMAGAIWVLVTYPQSVTLVVFILCAMLWSSASAWAFDEFYFWLPVFSPLCQLLAICLVFLSYQLSINERRTWRLEQEQRHLQDLQEVEQLKTNFVSMMSHDLKTPIAKIQAICDRLITVMQEGEMAQDLKTLRRSSDELHRYIQSILQVTKVEAKDFRIQKEPMDINDHIGRVVARIVPLAREKKIKIEMNLEPMFSIEADSTLIQEVIHNLLENAIKYTPPEGRVTVTSQEKDDNVIVLIEDSGPGIDRADQDGIWRKFTRGRNQNSAGGEVRGTGLGLYLVKYFVELHRGQVFLKSELGQGTEIGFSIPFSSEAVSFPSEFANAVASENPVGG